MPMKRVTRVLMVDEARGLMKITIHYEPKQILGCAVLEIGSGEALATLQIAMAGKPPDTRLRDGVFAPPTLAEAFDSLCTGVTQ